MGYHTMSLKGDGVQIFSIFEMGYEIFSFSVKLSSTQVPMIKNDCSLKLLVLASIYTVTDKYGKLLYKSKLVVCAVLYSQLLNGCKISRDRSRNLWCRVHS